LRLVGGRLFAADNGDVIDRFVEVDRGRDYLWNESDWGIGAAAAQVFAPSISPVQLDFCRGSGLPAAWRNRFYVAVSGQPAASGPDVRLTSKGVVALDYGLQDRRMRSVPRRLVRYRGTHRQSVVGLGCGPDGIYFVPLFPDTTGESPVLVARYAPDSSYPYPLSGDKDPLSLMDKNRCLGCHTFRGQGGSVAPALTYDSLIPRLQARLGSGDYRARILAVDSLTAEPFASYRSARAEVLDARGEIRLFTWIRYHLREPKFDNPGAQVPNLGLSAADAASLAQFLIIPGPLPADTAKRLPRGHVPRGRIARWLYGLPLPRRTQPALAFVGGLGVGAVLTRVARRRPPAD
jgi:hypothetical protein